jgi:hypothetical protein
MLLKGALCWKRRVQKHEKSNRIIRWQKAINLYVVKMFPRIAIGLVHLSFLVVTFYTIHTRDISGLGNNCALHQLVQMFSGQLRVSSLIKADRQSKSVWWLPHHLWLTQMLIIINHH